MEVNQIEESGSKMELIQNGNKKMSREKKRRNEG